ncbi:MAG: polysaccharide deacetylase family protein [Planctomycetota bacterium]
MNIEFQKIPWMIQRTLPLLTWRIKPRNRNDRRLFLTFDDGPTPGVTEQVLKELASFNAQATFFCLGEQAAQHPELVHELVRAGHVVANHGNQHLDGWKTSTQEYVEDVRMGQSQIPVETKHFRPPYGRFTFSQWWRLRKQYQCIMWDVTSQDYRAELSGSDIEAIVLEHATPGSIVLLHDSELAAPRMLAALPRLLRHYQDRGFQFATIP